MNVLRWGQSDYETDADLKLEADGARALGLGWQLRRDHAPPPELADVGALVVTSKVKVDADVLARLGGDPRDGQRPLVLTTTSGWDHIDVAEAHDRGITVGRLPEARRDAVVAHALGAMITLMRRFPAFDTAARDGRWARADLPKLAPVGLDRATVVVVGLGVIGQRMVEVLRPLRCRLVGVDPRWTREALDAASFPDVELATIEAALPRADVVTLHCALNPETRNLLSAPRLALLRPTAVLVNTARGKILDVAAAVEAVQADRLRGLHVDVFPQEPWPALGEHARVEGVQLSPHAAGFVADLGQRVASGVVEVLTAWRHGRRIPWALDR